MSVSRIEPSRVSPVSLRHILDFAPGHIRPLPGLYDFSVLAPMVWADDFFITSVVSDNRQAKPGALFIALPGHTVHGAVFARDAALRGAVAILTDPAGLDHMTPDSATGSTLTLVGAPILVADDPGALCGPLAALIYGQPAERMQSFAVTGTNGKTTVSFMVDHILRALGRVPGLIGTVMMRSGDQVLPSVLTTPQAADLQAILATMVEDGVDTLSMEVSSHALAQHRVDGMVFDCAGFTNLTPDHLDFHGSMENYYHAKAQLFTSDHARQAVVCVDDAWGQRLARRVQVSDIPVTTVRTQAAVDATPVSAADKTVTSDATPGATRGATVDRVKALIAQLAAERADWTVTDIEAQGTGHAFTLHGPQGVSIRTSTRLPGLFNVTNAALALVMVACSLEDSKPGDMTPAGSGEDEGRDPGDSSLPARIRRLEEALALAGGVSPQVPGRMQVIEPGTTNEQGEGLPCVIVDFAHNTESLQLALAAVRDTTEHVLYVVFGSAGDRDKGKRPLMGRAAVHGANVVIITDDDPHGEDPAAIRADIKAGAVEALIEMADDESHHPVDLFVVADRAEAITMAIMAAGEGDTVLIAGRGHETIQEVQGVEHVLDDAVVARAALAERQLAETDS